MTIMVKLYALSLRWLPADLRADFGADMAQLFRDQLLATRGAVARLGLLMAALGGTIPLSTAVWGAIAGYVPLWLIATGFALLMKRQGMGGGDLKLLAALGAWLGWQAILPIILIASLVGLCVNVPRMLLGKHQRHQQYPFGPFLAGGGLFVMFVGNDTLLSWAGIDFGA